MMRDFELGLCANSSFTDRNRDTRYVAVGAATIDGIRRSTTGKYTNMNRDCLR